MRLPAYGKALLARRQAGDHPLSCTLSFAPFIPAPQSAEAFQTQPMLALKSTEYQGPFKERDQVIVPGGRIGKVIEILDDGGLKVAFADDEPRDYYGKVLRQAINFSIVTGMSVTVCVGRGARLRPLLWLAGELGRHAAAVTIEGYWDKPIQADHLAFQFGRNSGRRAWPRWWPAETEKANNERITYWFEDAFHRHANQAEERRAA